MINFKIMISIIITWLISTNLSSACIDIWEKNNKTIFDNIHFLFNISFILSLIIISIIIVINIIIDIIIILMKTNKKKKRKVIRYIIILFTILFIYFTYSYLRVYISPACGL